MKAIGLINKKEVTVRKLPLCERVFLYTEENSIPWGQNT